MFLLTIFLVFVLFFGFPITSSAVLPPDFIFNITSQIIQLFSVSIVLLSVTFGSAYSFLKNKYSEFKLSKKNIIIVFSSILIVSFLIAFIYGKIKQQNEYKNWIRESQANTAPRTGDLGELIKIGEQNKTKTDVNIQFVKDYYSNIEKRNYEKAYEMSKKSVDFETFKGWYANVSKISIDKILKIDDTKLSLELAMTEGEKTIKMNVLITLLTVNEKPERIEWSEVKIIEDGTVETSKNFMFFDSNSNLKTAISNKEFKEIYSKNKDETFILDARENIEYENGYMSGSTHIRFADIKAGRWIELPSEQVVYVFCWSGIRGKEVTEFLRSKKILARYIEKGASDWVAFGGEWNGNIKFVEKYSEYRFQRVMTTEETKEEVKNGAVLVDCREPEKYNQGHIPGSINIPTMYTPSTQYEEVMNQVPKNSKIIAICDAYVNCFDAKITGVELEKRGATLLGRYNKPWEYEK